MPVTLVVPLLVCGSVVAAAFPLLLPLSAIAAAMGLAVADGLTNAEIGSRLVIAEATVKTCLLRLFAKLEVNDRTHAVVKAMERGLLRRP
ncbi:LuxR C-terminal-related transcriptional regulator [Nonomuraea fuscirosea]|uniref:response regulator transcription factor n=1 Tax=Nonomuraea fuscirosea TaxID=1291556 RepID=UPI003794665C